MKVRTAAAVVALLVSAGATAATAETGDATLAPTSERINFNIGCNKTDETTPTCDTTDYWLGTDTGTESVASTFDATPIGYAFYTLDGGYQPTTFAGNDTLRDTYTLIGGSVVKGQVVLSGYASGAEAGVDSAVQVALSAVRQDLPKPRVVELGTVEVTKTVSTPIDTTYAFEFTVPAALDGVPVGKLTADVAQRHVTVLQNGFMDGQGGSYFDLPFLAPATE